MEKLGKLPVSAYNAYSRKRKNEDNSLISKKKKNKNLSDKSSGASSMNVENTAHDNKKKRDKKPFINGNAKSNLLKSKSQSKKNFSKKRQAAGSSQSMNGLANGKNSKHRMPTINVTPSTSKTSQKKMSKKDKSRSLPTIDNNEMIANNEVPDENLGTCMVEDIPKTLSNDPVEEAKSLFQWLINPVSIDDFFAENWERAPLQIKRQKSSYYKLLMSTPMLDSILRNFHVLYSKNIDITSYSDGKRETHNPPGRALPTVVWDYYSNGCSIRMLNPQTFIPKLHALNATLQEFFGCFVGANSYLTPPDSQGFAPHYDDIEAFILQIEGKKRWRLYKSRNDEEYLPRYSSKNFDPSEIGEPILDTVINAGDLLYFPRGTIHQGETIDGTHSLHITLSVYQKNSWCDFLEKLLPEALKTAIASDSKFREGLPLDYSKHVGFVNSTLNTEERQSFIANTKKLLQRMIDNIDVDKAADEMAKENIHDFLPPVLSPQEQERSVLKDGERMVDEGVIDNRIEIEPDTKIRLLRSHCIRVVEEDDCVKMYYSTENSKEYHEYELQSLEAAKELAPAVQKLIQTYPNFIKVDDLPIEGEDNKVQVARDLWEKCIVVTDVPLPIVD